METDESLEDFRKRAIALSGFLSANFNEDRLNHVIETAQGDDPIAKKQIKRELELLQYEIEDMRKAADRVKKILKA